MRKEILSFTGDRPDGRLIHILEEAAVHTDGFTAEQDSFFVFVMRPDMIKRSAMKKGHPAMPRWL